MFLYTMRSKISYAVKLAAFMSNIIMSVRTLVHTVATSIKARFCFLRDHLEHTGTFD